MKSLMYPTNINQDMLNGQGKRNNFINAVDTGQNTSNPQLLALRHINSGQETSLEILNDFLSLSQNMDNALEIPTKISQEQLDKLLAITPVNVELSSDLGPLYNAAGPVIMRKNPDYLLQRKAGVYVFTCSVTGEKYVGSSVDLARRVRSYFHDRELTHGGRPINVSLNTYGIASHSLSLYILDPKVHITEGQDHTILITLCRALEQYIIFASNPALNVMKVVGLPYIYQLTEADRAKISEVNSRPLYLYNKDKSILLGVYKSAQYFADETGLGYSTVNRYHNSGDVLFGKFVLSRKLYPVEETQQMDLALVYEVIADYRKDAFLPTEKPQGKSSRMFSSHGKHRYTLTDVSTDVVLEMPTATAVVAHTRAAGRLLNAEKLSRMVEGTTLDQRGWILYKHPLATNRGT
jgi:hypothetical protein